MYTALLPLVLAILPTLVHSDVITGIPDSAPPGFEEWVSPVVRHTLSITPAR